VEVCFDDCQALVKASSADPELNKRFVLSSAIRSHFPFVPQAFYYVAAAERRSVRIRSRGSSTPGASFRAAPPAGLGTKPVEFFVPRNIGNLTPASTLCGWRPIDRFIAATNAKRTVPITWERLYQPRSSQAPSLTLWTLGAPAISNEWRLSGPTMNCPGTFPARASATT
jgi:hypothetical protein